MEVKMIKCEKCIHKEVCSWKELVKTLYTDYEKMVEENTSTYPSGCPVKYINDPFKCDHFRESSNMLLRGIGEDGE